MKKLINHIRNRVLAGLIFLIPLFAIILILQKVWKALTGAGNYLATLLGLKTLVGDNSMQVATALVLIFLLYFCGWLVKFSTLTKMRDWVEDSLLQYIPGYLTYKAQVQEKINPKKDNRIPVWVTTVVGKRPGFLIDEQTEETIVFFPNSPDSNNGEIVAVANSLVKKIDMNASSFIKSMQKFGKDLSTV